MTSTVTVNDDTSGTQSVEVQFQDPTNGEKCFLVVQQISMMNADDTLVTFSDDNKIVGNVICQDDTATNEPNDSLSEINFANDDVIKLEDSSSLALVDVEDLESEIITDAYGKSLRFFLINSDERCMNEKNFQTLTPMTIVHRIPKILSLPLMMQSLNYYSKRKTIKMRLNSPQNRLNPMDNSHKTNHTFYPMKISQLQHHHRQKL